MSPRSILGLALLLAGLPSCDSVEEPPSHRIAFDIQLGGESFRCGGRYDGVGVSGTTVEPLDARFYVHDVTLRTASGAEVPLELEQDQAWQRGSVALLDFADDTGRCETGSPQTRMEVVGTADTDEEIVGVAFTLGLPAEDNHIDAVRSPAPFNAPGMWWSWTGGFKYARIDVATDANPTWFLHLGATSCEGSPAQGFGCAWENLPRIELGAMNPDTQAVVLDLGRLYEASDLDASIDYETDFINGCMAFSGDPECAPIFERLGVEFEGDGAFEQRAFVAK
ncbi:MAG: MbnP family copper-binding protein [Nannocystaceae bacterium]|nr:metallo-mystery pair system four-Cys motif protein [bacterium]